MRPSDLSGRAVDERVVAACNRLWRWAYFHVEAKLHDAPSAAELMEEVALDVSRRLQAEPTVERNLTGYVITAFHRRVSSQLVKNNRLVYVGLVRELEQNHQMATANWTEKLHDRLVLQVLVPLLSHPVRHMLHYRMLGFGWSAIGKRMDMSAKQAKTRFYYGIQRACERLMTIPSKLGSNEEPEDDE
jgi:DNA-directed RNA polymerase specialized sigma24 family protein